MGVRKREKEGKEARKRKHNNYVRIQGVIYPVSHRSLRIKFWALRTNCETQSKKVRIKKKSSAKRCNRCIALDSQQLAAAIAIASTISWNLLVQPRRSPAPVLNSRRVVSAADNAQFLDLSAHSFGTARPEDVLGGVAFSRWKTFSKWQ